MSAQHILFATLISFLFFHFTVFLFLCIETHKNIKITNINKKKKKIITERTSKRVIRLWMKAKIILFDSKRLNNHNEDTRKREEVLNKINNSMNFFFRIVLFWMIKRENYYYSTIWCILMLVQFTLTHFEFKFELCKANDIVHWLTRWYNNIFFFIFIL